MRYIRVSLLAVVVAYVLLVDIVTWPLVALGMSLRRNRWVSAGPFKLHLFDALHRQLTS